MAVFVPDPENGVWGNFYGFTRYQHSSPLCLARARFVLYEFYTKQRALKGVTFRLWYTLWYTSLFFNSHSLIKSIN